MITKGQGDNFQKVCYAFGDSITQGSGFNPDPLQLWGYINYVAQCLGWKIVNNAVGGTKIEDAAHTANMALIKPTARRDRILWLTGYNDYRFYGNSSADIDAYGVRLQSALTTLSAHNCPIILGNVLRMVPAYYSLAPYDKGSDAAAAAYDVKIASVAAGFPLVQVIDITTLYNPLEVHLQGDHVHLNYLGTTALGKVFVNAIIAAGLR